MHITTTNDLHWLSIALFGKALHWLSRFASQKKKKNPGHASEIFVGIPLDVGDASNQIFFRMINRFPQLALKP